MLKTRISLLAAFISGMMWFASCVHDPQPPVIPDTGNYPPAIASIIVNKCAVAGCHNTASYQNSAGLLLDTWEHMLDGSNNGAAIVAYSPGLSPLLYFVNTDSTLGPVALPTMPLTITTAQPSLSRDEYLALRDWIASGAPDKNGNIPFAANADTRQKIYLTQQGCDLVAVIDADKNVVMRYIRVGTDSNNIESPHCIRISSDGKYAYVSFLAGQHIQKIDTRTDQVVGDVPVGIGSWNIVYLSPDNNVLAATDWVGDGRIVFSNTSTLQLIPGISGGGSGLFVYPHGITSTANFDTCFITAQYGNVIYRYAPYVPDYRKVSLNGMPPVTTGDNDNTSPNPHEILMAPDHSRYFVSCQGTNQVKVMDAHTDAIIATFSVGSFPQELALSHSKPYLFVTCMEDGNNNLPGRKGSVYVINYETNLMVTAIYGDFYQPHGIAVDDAGGKVYIASTNSNPSGPAPHHTTTCGGRAGWYSVYDLNTLQPVNNKRYEVTVMPYSADVRFKQ